MKKITKCRYLIVVPVFLIVFMLFSSSLAFGASFEFWNADNISWKFLKGFKGNLQQAFRTRTDGRGFYRTHTDLGIIYGGLTKSLDLEVNLI